MAIYQKRYGDRYDGRRIRSVQPMTRVANYIMPTRIGAQNLIRDKIDVDAIDLYIRKKRMEGLKGFGFLHILIAAYARVISQRPALNRYIGGQEIYARLNMTVALTIKREMTLDAPETVVKVPVTPYSTPHDIYESLNRLIQEGRAGEDSDFDEAARWFNLIPRFLLRWTIAFIKLLDYYNHMPRSLNTLSPFHASCFITSMGSLGIPPVFHHLYEFGNCPLFISYGPKRVEFVPQSDGSSLRKTFVEFTMSTDERICDGFYMASCLKEFQNIFRRPEMLDSPPESVVEDDE